MSELFSFSTARIAHRGVSACAPENTFASFDLAVQLGISSIELDLHMTRDGALVAMHDPTLNRTTSGVVRGPLREVTLDQIKAVDAGKWFNDRFPDKAHPRFLGLRIPTIEDVLERYWGKADLFIEVKCPGLYPGIERNLVEVLACFGLLPPTTAGSRVRVQSFSRSSLVTLHELAPALPLIRLFPRGETTDGVRAKLKDVRAYASGIGAWHTCVDPALVAATRLHGLSIYPYTVNDPNRMQELIAMRVNGIFTDVPDRSDLLLAAPLSA